MQKVACILILLLMFSSALYADDAPPADYVLGPGDVIEITVPSHEDIDKDLDQTLMILPDGKIAYPEVGEIRAAGKTPRDLAAAIKAVLERTRNNVRVVVSVKEIHSKRARVVGAIKAAGGYDLKPHWRLMDLVAMAGGLTARPTRIKGRLIRAGGKVFALDIAQAVARPDTDANMALEPDDLVLLDEQDIHNQVHVMGQVNKPGAYDLDESLTVISLLSEAGSTTDRAALSKAYVLRGSTQLPLNLLPTLVQGQVDETVTKLKLQPGDVLFVPEIEARYGVMGQVNRPGYYPVPEKGDATVLKALSEAGGQLQDADLRKAGIVRTVNGKATVTPINIEAILKKGNLAANVTLHADDVLYIPPRGRQSFRWEDLLSPITALYYLGFRAAR